MRIARAAGHLDPADGARLAIIAVLVLESTRLAVLTRVPVALADIEQRVGIVLPDTAELAIHPPTDRLVGRPEGHRPPEIDQRPIGLAHVLPDSRLGREDQRAVEQGELDGGLGACGSRKGSKYCDR